MSEKIWYACYGSNILRKRFDLYIEEINRKYGVEMKVHEEALYIFTHPIFFAESSSRWQNKGVAFLDYETKGATLGCRYLIDKEYFKYIKEMEGSSWYGKELYLGKDENNIDIYTLTCPDVTEFRKTEQTPPSASMDYISVIARGIQDRYLYDNNFIHENFGAMFKFIDGLDTSGENIERILNEHR